jgi:hypothetical protein
MWMYGVRKITTDYQGDDRANAPLLCKVLVPTNQCQTRSLPKRSEAVATKELEITTM